MIPYAQNQRQAGPGPIGAISVGARLLCGCEIGLIRACLRAEG